MQLFAGQHTRETLDKPLVERASRLRTVCGVARLLNRHTACPRCYMLFDNWLPEAMKRERVTEDDLHAALRAQGLGRVAHVAAVVMETDGSLSVISQPDGGAPLDVLRHVRSDAAVS